MAAIRDFATNYISTAGTALPGYLPNNAAGDLLLAVVNARVTGATITSSGWTLLNNTSITNLTTAILWKIATSNETDPTFTITSSAGGVHITSIQDIYQTTGATGPGSSTTPFNGTGGAGATGIRVTSGTAVAVRGFMPVLTTTADSSLILYVVTTANALVPMVLEGPCIYEYGADYSTSSNSLSWGWQKTAGNTPSTVGYSVTASGTTALISATIGVSPPAAGASVIPTYCASDNSTYIDPINGVTAFGTNSAFAVISGASGATGVFSMYYGASGPPRGATGIIGGAPVVSGTVTAAVDSGLNPYHSMAQLANTPVVGKTWKGAVLALGTAGATGIDVGNKNILVHTKPASPAALETTDTIGRPLTKGVAIGIGSGATGANYTVWHTHGAGTAFSSATHVPMIINAGATGVAGATGSGVISKVGTLNTSSIKSIGFFTSAAGASGPSWQFGSAWALDTTVVAGGNAANPIDIKGMVKATSTGKERLSVIQQGNAQALILQPIQFGNGGTDNIYLNLDSSAIEFPTQYNINKKQVFYNSYDNVAGISYYAGSSDTIIHTNATIQSANKYFWGFNSSTSASATYNFAGTVISGAGTVTLSANAPLTSVTFQACDQIAANGATLTLCVFSSSAATSGQGAVSITGSTQTALQTALDKLVSCTFSNNTTSSGALRIIYTGAGGSTITLTNADKIFSGNTTDIYWDAPASTPLVFTQTTTTANASSSAATNSNTVTINNTTTFVKINFDSYLSADGANAKYKMFYNQVNTTGSGNVPGKSCAFGTSSAVLVKALSTDLSGDGSLEVKGNLTGNITTVTFNYDYIYNTQASWTKNTPYSVGDEYSYRVGATTTWYRVTTAYTSGATRTSILDGANATAISGPTIVLVTIGTENAEYFKTTGTIIPYQTTVVSATSVKELNYVSS